MRLIYTIKWYAGSMESVLGLVLAGSFFDSSGRRLTGMVGDLELPVGAFEAVALRLFSLRVGRLHGAHALAHPLRLGRSTRFIRFVGDAGCELLF